MDQKIKKITLENDTFFVRKNKFGYRVVYPMRNEDGSMNWFNTLTGGWNNLLFVLIAVSFLIWVLVDSHNKVEEYRAKCTLAMEDPVAFCGSIGYYDAVDKLREGKREFHFNLSAINNQTNVTS